MKLQDMSCVELFSFLYSDGFRSSLWFRSKMRYDTIRCWYWLDSDVILMRNWCYTGVFLFYEAHVEKLKPWRESLQVVFRRWWWRWRWGDHTVAGRSYGRRRWGEGSWYGRLLRWWCACARRGRRLLPDGNSALSTKLLRIVTTLWVSPTLFPFFLCSFSSSF